VAEGGLVFAFHAHQDRFHVPADDVVAVDGVEPRLAALFPLVETALQITLDAGAVLEDTVLVVGLGAVGLLTALLLHRAGARVVASDPRPWRRRVAGDLGVEAVEPRSLPDRIGALTDGAVPLAVEVSGDPEALSPVLPLLSHEGTVLVASWYGDKQVMLPLGREFHRRRLSIRSTQVSTIPAALSDRWTVRRRRRRARSLLEDLPLAALATHAFPFTAAGEAFAAVDRGDEGLIHAALRYH
jgi:threonine dehydrogenase-like Zn-dependent dehydrogenase